MSHAQVSEIGCPEGFAPCHGSAVSLLLKCPETFTGKEVVPGFFSDNPQSFVVEIGLIDLKVLQFTNINLSGQGEIL